MRNHFALTAAALFVVCVAVAAANDEPCTPGQVKMKDCNTCRCTPTGVWACTRMGCPDEDEAVKVVVERDARQCEPNSTFQQGCNWCTCNSDGTAAICTAKACLPPRNPGRRRRATACTPGTIFKRGCNMCHCMRDARTVVCSARQCPNQSQ